MLAEELSEGWDGYVKLVIPIQALYFRNSRFREGLWHEESTERRIARRRVWETAESQRR